LNKAPLVIWGASGHAKVVADAASIGEDYQILGFLLDGLPSGTLSVFEGHPILGGRDKLPELRRAGSVKLIFGFADCKAKLHLSDLVTDADIEFATVVHPRAVLARNAIIGAGAFIAAGAVVNPGTVLGRHVILNTLASVDHDCVIEDAANICPGVHLAGNVTIGKGAWLGIGSVVKEKTKVGAASVIGAGAVVVNDIPAGVVAYGCPARVKGEVKTQ